MHMARREIAPKFFMAALPFFKTMDEAALAQARRWWMPKRQAMVAIEWQHGSWRSLSVR